MKKLEKRLELVCRNTIARNLSFCSAREELGNNSKKYNDLEETAIDLVLTIMNDPNFVLDDIEIIKMCQNFSEIISGNTMRMITSLPLRWVNVDYFWRHSHEQTAFHAQSLYEAICKKRGRAAEWHIAGFFIKCCENECFLRVYLERKTMF